MGQLVRSRKNHTARPIKMADLVPLDQPDEIMAEVDKICQLLPMQVNLDFVHKVFGNIKRLFAGEFPKFKGCNTEFHDLQHTTDCFIAMARLIHGAVVSGEVEFEEREVMLGLVTALMHDTGYIQKTKETDGTGGCYTLVHVQRSIEFMEAYFQERGLSYEDFELCRRCVKCTGLDVQIDALQFEGRRHEILGKMLGTADLLGQIASRTYLEKLTFLYQEFEEAGVPGFEDELDLLVKTSAFYNTTKKRLANELDGVCRFMRPHFLARWNIDRNLYEEAMEGNIEYLNYVLNNYKKDYRNHLRRGGLMDKKKIL